MHEFSQSAEAIDWAKTPYFYASADATPLLVMAMWDYIRASGDVNYLKQNWAAIRKAYEFERSHDSDGDGIYENTEGTGWVESWPPGMPHQEIYLAALDQQACTAMSQLAPLAGEPQLASAAAEQAEKIGRNIESEYLNTKEQFYAFSRNPDGSLDNTPSIYPSVAWWQGTYSLLNASPMLSRWAAPELSTDWGTRDISDKSPYFDPISYHQGSVWPLFTGWVSLAEYRAGRPLSGFTHLYQNVRLTWLQDLGSATELLSGQFYQPLGRSSSHQMWSSAMIITPALRGLFGLQPDAVNRTLLVQPHLPAIWTDAHIHNFHIGEQTVDIDFERAGQTLKVTAKSDAPGILCLVNQPSRPCSQAASKVHLLSVPLPPVEIGLPDESPQEGDSTHATKVLAERYTARTAEFQLAAPAGSKVNLFVRKNNSQVQSDSAKLVEFPAGSGYQTTTVTFHW
jgi:glycogen debranching enzyme